MLDVVTKRKVGKKIDQMLRILDRWETSQKRIWRKGIV